jgi:(S)-ureidoglycine aminohydrolase
MVKKIRIIICFLFPAIVYAQDTIPSGVYNWNQPVKTHIKQIKSSVIFEGSVYDMEWLQMSANEVLFSKAKTDLHVPANEEQLYIIKKGTVNITVHDTVTSLGSGSIALLMPGERFSIQNNQAVPCTYYIMKYRSKSPVDMERGNIAGGSFALDWNKISFIPHDKGGIRNYFERPTAMGKRLEMHVTTLNPGIKSHDPHTHRAEEMVLMINGNTEMQIGQSFYKGNEGSVFYLGSNVLHAIRNTGSAPCTYFAFQFE